MCDVASKVRGLFVQEYGLALSEANRGVMPDYIVDSSRAYELFKQLLVKTQEKRLSWSRTAESGVYIAPVEGKYLFRALPRKESPFSDLDTLLGNPQLAYPRFQLVEGNDILIEIAKSDRVNEGNLNSLYEMVRHQALQIDEKLSKVDGVLTKLREL